MPRISIYVDEELKARIEAAGDEISWAPIAQRAFREALSIHAMKNGDISMENVIERLRTSKKKAMAEEYEKGNSAGTEWAQMSAEYKELVSIAELSDANYDITANDVARHALNNKEADGLEIAEFWEEVAGTYEPSVSYAHGFAEGAIEVWKSVADKL